MDKLNYDAVVARLSAIAPGVAVDVTMWQIKRSIDIKRLIAEIEQSEYLKRWQRVSQYINHYDKIITGKYRDFRKLDNNKIMPNKQNGTQSHSCRFEGERQYTKQELEDVFDKLGNIDDLLN